MTSSLPQITLMVAFGGTNPVYANYNTSKYDDGTKYAPDNLAADISIYFRDQFAITRGSSQIPFTGLIAEAGKFTTNLSNFDRRFDPSFVTGPYVSAGVTHVVPGVSVVVTATWNSITYFLFSGIVSGWPQTYPALGRDQDVHLQADDGIRLLARAQLTKILPASSTGERISAILDAIGFPPTQRTISPGDTRVPYSTNTVSAWSAMTDTANAEWGDLFLDTLGDVVFRDRNAIASDPKLLTSQFTFGDANDGVELPFHDVTVGYDDAVIINDATLIYNSIGSKKEAGDATSQTRAWGTVSWNQSYMMISGADAQQFVNWLIHRYSFPALRIESLIVKPQKDPTRLYPAVLSLDLGDRITVKLTPQGGGARIVRQVFIRGIAHNYSNRAWQTTYTLQDADWTSELSHYNSSQYDDGKIYGF